jgi:multidrug resistance efflux pump
MIRAGLIVVALGVVLLASLGLYAGFVELDFTTTIPGRVMPRRVLRVALPHAGTVTRLAAAGPVAEGEVVLALDATAEKERLAFLRRRLARLAEEIEKEKPPLGAYRRRYSLTEEKATLTQEVKALERTVREKTFTAPFSGRVLRTLGQTGAHAPAGKVLLVLADTGAWRFAGAATPQQRVDLRLGQPARIRLESYPYPRYDELPAELTAIETVLEAPETTSYQLTFRFRKAPPVALEPGLTGTCLVVTFHGTTLEYLLQERAAGLPGGLPAGGGER